tara:strand:+ start:55 stop:519 length:465 start_codon:yes stop_codon:yes gene_type:complete
MAIARGAGTEIIRTIFLEDTDDQQQELIIGIQHHIYTVLSITCRCISRNGSENGNIKLEGWDSFAGASNQTIHIATVSCAAGETFVWSDKFSFNGTEPTGLSGRFGAGDAAADLAYQDAIADQGSSTRQLLKMYTDSSGTVFDVTCTYIDQNNA